MSIEAVGRALFIATGNPTRKAILIALANYADEHGCCWPSVGRLADIAEVSVRSARAHLRGLEEEGLITVEPRSRDGGKGQTSNQYRLHFDPRRDLPGGPEADDLPPRKLAAGGIEEPSSESSGEHDLFGSVDHGRDLTARETEALFSNLWATHRKGDKQKALAWYRKTLASGVSHETIRLALDMYVGTFRADFTGAHLWRWLRDRRWEEWEEHIAKPSANGSKVTEGSAARFM